MTRRTPRKKFERGGRIKLPREMDSEGRASSLRKDGISWVDGLILGMLMCFFAFQTVTTWRKWPDILIDYGRELYVPWQITKGAILYQDIVYYYGPLGAHLNAGLFWLFGVGFSTLFVANLVMLAGFSVCFYFLLKKMTDWMAAGLSVFLFLSAFAFGNFVGVGNYNFISPYSHDTTYGFYLCVGLLASLWAWMSSGNRAWIALAGLAFGGAYLTKPEITIASLAIVGVAFLASIILSRAPISAGSWRSMVLSWLLFVGCAAIPVVSFTAWFVVQIPGAGGWTSIHSAWIAALGSDTLRNSLVTLTFTGMDRPLENVGRMLSVSSLGVAVFLGIFGLGWLAGRYKTSSPVFANFCAAVLLIFTGWLLYTLSGDFLQIGRILVVSSALLVLYRSVFFLKHPDARNAARAMWSGLGFALLLKMLFNPRIEHYGFFQALPAMIDLALFLISDIPRLQSRLGGATKVSRIASSLLVFSVAVGLLLRAHVVWELKVLSVSSGADRIETFDERISPNGVIMNELQKEILLRHPGAESLMVFPEGISLNFLVRLKNPSPLYEFVPPALAFYGQDRLIGDMERSPPDLIVIISRDIREFGSVVFGDDAISGRKLVEWMEARYVISATVGGNPLQPNQMGALLLTKKQQ